MFCIRKFFKSTHSFSTLLQVSDRILADEDSSEGSWTPLLFESPELDLPLLIPEDGFPSDDLENGMQVTDLVRYLQTALNKSWCRLTTKQQKGREGQPATWNTYLSSAAGGDNETTETTMPPPEESEATDTSLSVS